MRVTIATRLDKLNRRLPPTWGDLARVILAAGDEMNQAEIDAYLAHMSGNGAPEQETLWATWVHRNRARIWAVWDERYPGWQDAPFWNEQEAAGQSENTEHEEY